MYVHQLNRTQVSILVWAALGLKFEIIVNQFKPMSDDGSIIEDVFVDSWNAVGAVLEAMRGEGTITIGERVSFTPERAKTVTHDGETTVALMKCFVEHRFGKRVPRELIPALQAGATER